MNKFKITSKVTQTPRMTYLPLRYIISTTTPTSIVSSVVGISGIKFSIRVLKLVAYTWIPTCTLQTDTNKAKRILSSF